MIIQFYNLKNNIYPGTSRHVFDEVSLVRTLAPLKCDTVSFTAMKKSKFQGFDLAVVEKFKAPIEKFRNYNDLQIWAANELNQITSKEYTGRQKEVTLKRNVLINIWKDYLSEDKDTYTPAVSLMIMSALTKDLKPDSDKLPPILNEDVLKSVLEELAANLNSDPHYKFDFGKNYEKALQAAFLDEEGGTDKDITGWVVIPSLVHDEANYELNKSKLSVLSYKTWCTKSLASDLYLRKGDFRIYLEHGKPKLAIRFLNDTVVDIAGVENNNVIPLNYLQTVKDEVANLKLSEDVECSIVNAENLKNKIEKTKKELADDIKNNNFMNIFEYFGMNPREDKDGNITLYCYRQPDEFTFKDLGIDENKLFENVVKIKNSADFSHSDLKVLANLEEIGLDAVFGKSQITSLPKLVKIGGNAHFTNSKIMTTGSLREIGGNAYFNNSSVVSLEHLKHIGRSAYFNDSCVMDLGDLEIIDGNANFVNSQMISLKNLYYIGKYADFAYSKIKDYGKLETVDGKKFEHK